MYSGTCLIRHSFGKKNVGLEELNVWDLCKID